MTDTRPCILVVDSDIKVTEHIKRTLEAEDYWVQVAGDGVSALAILQSQAVDLILADISVPGTNDRKLYAEMHEHPRWKDIPLVILTGQGISCDVRYEGSDYLTKPFQTEDLMAIVWSRLHQARQQAVSHSRIILEPRFLTVGRLRLDVVKHYAWMGEQEFILPAPEHTLLVHLMQQASNMASAQELARVVYGIHTDFANAQARLQPLVFSLRHRLAFFVEGKDCVSEIPGVGYHLLIPD